MYTTVKLSPTISLYKDYRVRWIPFIVCCLDSYNLLLLGDVTKLNYVITDCFLYRLQYEGEIYHCLMFLYILENQVGVLSEDIEHIRIIDSFQVTI